MKALIGNGYFMNQRTITIIIGLFLLVIVGMFAFAYFTRDDEVNDDAIMTDDTAMEETPYDNITRITAKHFYVDGIHTLAGEVMMPTACDLLETNSTVAESMPEQVTIDFSVINNSETCAQAMTTQRFIVSFDASEEANITGRFMGRDIELNLVPPSEGETPEDFELFIKG